MTNRQNIVRVVARVRRVEGVEKVTSEILPKDLRIDYSGASYARGSSEPIGAKVLASENTS